MTGATQAAVPLAVAMVLTGCDQAEMRDQPKYEAYEKAETLPGGRSALTPPEGAVARHEELAPRVPRAALSKARLRHGRQLFNAICAPCHSPLGDGRGMVVIRGFPPPPTFHSERLRKASDKHFYDVITNGRGIMYSYANRLRPAERWAVIGYIRALQLSQNAEVARLPEKLQRRLAERLR